MTPNDRKIDDPLMGSAAIQRDIAGLEELRAGTKRQNLGRHKQAQASNMPWEIFHPHADRISRKQLSFLYSTCLRPCLKYRIQCLEHLPCEEPRLVQSGEEMASGELSSSLHVSARRSSSKRSQVLHSATWEDKTQ